MVTGNDALAREIRDRGASADIPEDLGAILAFSEKLTLAPKEVREADLARLRAIGLDDRGILEVVEITAYFNFVNRLADGLGVGMEEPGI